MCGTPLVEQPRQVAMERKVVTVLFCDLVGFTARSDQADPEDVQARISPYHARLRTEIERYGGTVEKFIGDAVMAVFGAPAVHEDDAERAVRAGLTILDAITDLNEQDPGLDLQVRVGIETGEAVVTLGARPEQGEGFVTGDVVNTASRLQGAAPVNSVAVGEGTFAATKDIFEYVALAPVVLKGKAQPVPLWHAVSARARFGTDLTRKFTIAMVGRELERDILIGTFERAVRDASVQLITVVGEPGVGKSRLVAELFSHVEDRPGLVRWRQGRCLPYGEAITFWALGEIVKAEAGILESDDPDTAASKIDGVIPEPHPDAPWLRQRLRPLVGLEAPPADREENFAAWRGFLELLADTHPSIFVFEDLHWADDAFLAFLEHVAEYAQGVPMLVVGTARPELFERAPAWISTARNANRINLAPLSEPDTEALVSNLLGQAAPPAEVRTAILRSSGGNPLYAEEFVRLLKDQDILRKHGSAWAVERGAEIPVPSGVRGLIAARLDTLPRERKDLLQDAAVMGKVFWSGAVSRMGEHDGRQVDEALHELTRKELIRRARMSSVAGETEYAFFHAVLRDVCYAQIPRAARAARHVRAAGWIEEMAGSRVEDYAEILASHYFVALELTTSAGTTDGTKEELQAKSLHYLTLAGDRALGIDVEAAERYYARALDLIPAADLQRPGLLVRHAEALRERGRFPEAARAYEEAIDGLRGQADIQGMAAAMGGYAISLFWLGDARRRAVFDEAVATLEPLGPSPELVKALAEQAGGAMISGDLQVAIAAGDRAIAMATELGAPEPARALGFRGNSRAFLGDAGGVEDMRRALDLAIAQGLGRQVALLHTNLGNALWPLQGPRALLDAAHSGGAFAERRGIEEFVRAAAVQHLTALVALGAYDEARTLASELVARLEVAEAVIGLIEVRAAQVRVQTRQGEYEAAAPLASWAVEKARASGQAQAPVLAFLPAAALRLAVGDAASARRLLAELLPTAAAAGTPEFVANLTEAVSTALGAGDPELAVRIVEAIEPIYPLHEHALIHARALLQEHDGAHHEAAALFADVAVRWRNFEMPWEQAQALLGQARCLLVTGSRTDASAVLRQAREIFVELGATPAIGETDTLLGTVARQAETGHSIPWRAVN
jgi:class 3 adenylate cyclase/tetratricopeptide (TPR) repeat protein